jgi:hypothetical protein
MLWITEKYVDRNKGHVYSVVDWYETRFDDGQLRDLLRFCSKTFGRVRSMWRDKPGGGRAQVGWVFEKRVEYEDVSKTRPARERTYLRETWVEVSIGDPRQATPAPVVVSPWA